MNSRKIKIAIIFTCMLLTSVFVIPTAAQGFSGTGAGTIGDPFLVSSCAQFIEVQDDLAASYQLTADLPCASAGNNIILSDLNQNVPFTGTLDGNNKSITIAVDTGIVDIAGLFRTIDGATISDLTINGTVDGNWELGGLAGRATDSEITNVTSNVIVSGGNLVGGLIGRTIMTNTFTFVNATGAVTGLDNVGGLIGRTSTLTEITKSYATGDASGDDEVGGFVGYNESVIEQSFATGNVTASGAEVGGFAGYGGGETYDSYARGDVTGAGNVGGFVGSRDCGDNFRSYSTGLIFADGIDGGFVGNDYCGVVNSLFWDTETSGIGTDEIAIGKSTAEMKDIATFTDLNTAGLLAPWDLSGTQNDDAATEDIWAIDGVTNDGYPFFGWSVPAEEVNDNILTNGYISTLTGKEVGLNVTGDCDNGEVGEQAESSHSVQDIGFDYPDGFVRFNLSSCAVGTTVRIEISFFDVSDPSLILRKYIARTGAYFTVDNVTYSRTVTDGVPITTVVYFVTDGGALDDDGIANGTIIDPVGLGKIVVGAPRTGAGDTA